MLNSGEMVFLKVGLLEITQHGSRAHSVSSAWNEQLEVG